MLALRSMYIMFRDLWGPQKRLHVKAVTLPGHLSMACWAWRRRLGAPPGVNAVVSVLFLTHRNADLSMWHCTAVVCGKVKNQALSQNKV